MDDASTQFLPAELARHTVESLETEHGGKRPWIYWLVLAGVTALLGCLPFIEVDVSVRAAGLIRPATDRVELRPSVSGRIAEVLVQDNDRVVVGQPLVVLTSRDLEERLARNRARQGEHADLVFDLRLLTLASTRATDQAGPDQAEKAVKSAAGFKTPALSREQAQLLAQLAAGHLAEGRARAEFERYSILAAKGVTSRSELERTRYELERLQSETGLLIRQSLARWQSRLREEEISVGDLLSEEKRLLEEKTQFTIRAPVEGLLVGFTGWSVGGFISSGQTLGAVSPNDSLLVEALVSSRDIGLISRGQAVKIQVDAFPYTQWGVLDGTVRSVSGDVVPAGASGPPASPVFKVIIRPAATALRLPSGLRGELRKGLTVQTRLLVARRSLFQFLHAGVNSWLNPQDSARGALPVTRF